jgi:hypothetical protein
MKIDVTKLISDLDSKEIDVLLKIYYCHEGVFNNSNDFEEGIIRSLTDKNLVSVNIESNENIIDLTNYGLSVCGTVLFNRINEKQNQFKKDISKIPERAVSCFVNRILWKDEGLVEKSYEDSLLKDILSDENLWYERALLHDERIGNALEEFYIILENLNFIENDNGQRWCLPEVEDFLKEEYKKIMNLTWNEEDSLKYYQFLYIYSQEQKNLINFTGSVADYRSRIYSDKIKPINYMTPSTGSDSKIILKYFGLSEKRVTSFLQDMQREGIVSQRYYPLNSSPFFDDDYKIFVINDIRDYMDYIKIHFLKPVVDSLLE